MLIYSLAYLELEEALKGYNAERYNDANTAMSSVSACATTCEDGFKEGKGVVSPLTKRNNEIYQLSCMALSIMWMLNPIPFLVGNENDYFKYIYINYSIPCF